MLMQVMPSSAKKIIFNFSFLFLVYIIKTYDGNKNKTITMDKQLTIGGGPRYRARIPYPLELAQKT